MDPTHRDSLNRLMGAVRESRDRQAFAELFTYYAPRLKGFFLKRGCDAASAEELVQEVMLTLWHKAAKFDASRSHVSAWLFTIARNRFIDRVRRERRPEPDRHDPCLAAAAAELDTQVDASRAHGILQRCIQTLPPEQAEVVVDAYYRGWSMSEVAQERKIPIGTVKTRVRIAMNRLRKALGERDSS